MRTTLVCLVLASSLLGCKKKADTAASGSGSAAGSAAAPAAAFSGTLTPDIIMNAAHQIDVYTPDGKPATFASALAAAKTKLGEPTKVDGTKQMWGVVAGDKCTFYVLEDKGGNASSPGSATVPATDADCLAATGKAPAAPAAGSGSDAAGSGSAAAAGSGSAAAGSGSAAK